ncbi:putative quercetin 2,3-dioxygenase [Skermanella aerolata]|uniref:Putative quercetin 2,3-dioxygenase n=1 Tax=Skermanella aerolata TaxID=393310 RepID=A0A512DKK7_9PROT|nr:pirin family protein [Skermanella aerolata]KJB96846.1 pirin [Skermanella aerolata KACC 11604]GEO37007.1 putative quercetin 2,3-dioxygenase [Skermanella aerolata]
MIEVIPFASLGRFDNEWLAARYHFSFANYRHRERDGLGPLLVWNDDTIQPGTGFPRHGHRDMEIITYVREGAITHEDHLGNVGRTEAGDVQVMSAGKGILHAEFNKEAEPARIFQIWIMPDAEGHKPRWETKAFPKGEAAGRLVVLASGREGDGDKGALAINQDAALLGATLPAGTTVTHAIGQGRQAYLVVARGTVRVNGTQVGERDGAVVSGESAIAIEAVGEAELLIADLP